MTTTHPQPTSTTAPLTHITPLRSCSLCTSQNPTDFSPTTTHLSTCTLCARDFCPLHASNTSPDQTCTADHEAYHNDRLVRTRDALASHIDRTSNNSELELEVGARAALKREGVYPSVEERQKVMWMDEAAGLLEAVSQMHKKKNAVRSPLLETKSFIGADIAV